MTVPIHPAVAALLEAQDKMRVLLSTLRQSREDFRKTCGVSLKPDPVEAEIEAKIAELDAIVRSHVLARLDEEAS